MSAEELGAEAFKNELALNEAIKLFKKTLDVGSRQLVKAFERGYATERDRENFKQRRSINARRS